MLHNKYFEIMKEFLNGYNREIYGRELIGKIKISQKNISNTLVELEKEGVLKSSFSGNRRYYSLNFENFLLRDYLSFFEEGVKISFLKHNSVLVDFFRKISGEIVCVFGSYAKGKNKKESDLDLLIVGGNSAEILRIGKEYGLNAQVFEISLNDFRKGFKENLILNECLKNHILINGRDLFIEEVLKWMD